MSRQKYVFPFGNGAADGDGNMKDVLGGKGAGLAEMSRAGIPVPPGFTISTDACKCYYATGGKLSSEIEEEIEEALLQLERRIGQKLGDINNPLLVSVRSGAKFSMPGMMDTVLNLGLNDETVEALIKRSGSARFACDCYRRFIQMFGDVVLEVPKDEFEKIVESQKKRGGARLDTELNEADLRKIVAEYKRLVEKISGEPFPQDAYTQLMLTRDAVFRSWNTTRAVTYRRIHKIPDDLGTAVNVQAMVFGNLSERSGTGVGFTRNPATGAKEFYGEFLINAQGEDVVAGVRTPAPISELATLMPSVYAQLREITTKLEQHYRDLQDFEFTIQDGKLYMLQTRSGKRTGLAAVNIAVDMVNEGLIDHKEAVMRVDPMQIDQLLHPVIVPSSRKQLQMVAQGLPASPGAAVGRIVFTADEAVEQAKNYPMILVRAETSPDDIHGMEVAKAILTSRGGMTSHAAVVARGMGTPCVAGASGIRIDETNKLLVVKNESIDLTLKEGDWLSLDGSTGDVFAGRAETQEPDLSEGNFSTFMHWADQFRGSFGIRANADIPRDAKVAKRFGATGIGLCRTEHMFFAPDRVKYMQEMILASDDVSRSRTLDKLLPFQRDDFAGLFEVMDGLPVIIRTLDPPLHEFLPKRERLMVDLAKLPHADTKGKEEIASGYGIPVHEMESRLAELLRRVEELHEFNPMLGLRGCRLGILYPEITKMQARAIFEAVVLVTKKGIHVLPEIMIPLVGNVAELINQKEIVVQVADQVLGQAGMTGQKYMVGTMIEIPNAALTADEIAHEAEFFSFGTNDLTQTTLGISRDDYVKFSKAYERLKLFKADPFAVLNQDGVGDLIKQAVQLGRMSRPNLEVGICGEHAGEPSSVEFCFRVGMDYASCSPYRVPIARLAAAQAAIKMSGSTQTLQPVAA